jgi:cell division protein FtsX
MKTSSNATTFMVGILIGLLGGFLIGAFMGKSVFQLATVLVHLVTKGSKSDQDRMKFELLLQ